MSTFTNAVLGLVFVGLGLSGTLLMYKLWGYPYDEERFDSAAPRPLKLLHRVIGYCYLGLYLYLMSQMVPRLWTYEVELPARTVAHAVLGMAIGAILLVKIAIVRFFKHLEGTLVPFLGTTLLICTICLIGLSAPFAFRAAMLDTDAAGGRAESPANLERVRQLLPTAGFPAGAPLENLTSQETLRQGRTVLLGQCVQCHDLRTVLLRPRTPANWVQTVTRMADRSVFTPITEPQQWAVATYLIAITPTLQRGFQRRVAEDEETAVVQASAQAAEAEVTADDAAAAPTLGNGEEALQRLCIQCHGLAALEDAPPQSAADARALVLRMVDNGLRATQPELEAIMAYLTATYAR